MEPSTRHAIAGSGLLHVVFCVSRMGHAQLCTSKSAEHAQAAWAHPEYGVLLAVLVDTGTVTLWEEHAESDGNVILQLRACLDGKQSCVMAFAPQQLGLQLAVGSRDGCIRCLHLARRLVLASADLQSMQGAGCKAAGCGGRK